MPILEVEIMAVLEAVEITGGYRDSIVVYNVSIRLDDGEIVALVGPNGSGKSTLLKTIYGVARLFGGKVLFKGKDVTRVPPETKTKLGMSYVPQTENIFPDLTVQENLEMGAYLIHDQDIIKDRMELVFQLFPVLKAMRHRIAGELSGGQRQMLAMARALMTRPEVMFLDEPTAGLAPKIAMELLRTLVNIREETGIPMLLVEQHAKRALELSDRAYVLASGRIVAEGKGKDILEREDLQELFLGIHK